MQEGGRPAAEAKHAECSSQDVKKIFEAYMQCHQELHIDSTALELAIAHEDGPAQTDMNKQQPNHANGSPRATRRVTMKSREEYMQILQTESLQRGDEAETAHLADLMSCSHVLRTLRTSVRALLVRTASQETVEAGHSIPISEACYIVLAGEIRLVMPDCHHGGAAGNQDDHVVISTVLPGRCFGDVALLGEVARSRAAVMAGKPPALLMRVTERAYSVITQAIKVCVCVCVCVCGHVYLYVHGIRVFV
jgi:hypothetical protein